MNLIFNETSGPSLGRPGPKIFVQSYFTAIFIRDFSFGYIKKFLLDQFGKVFGSLRTINVNRNKKYKNFIG